MQIHIHKTGRPNSYFYRPAASSNRRRCGRTIINHYHDVHPNLQPSPNHQSHTHIQQFGKDNVYVNGPLISDTRESQQQPYPGRRRESQDEMREWYPSRRGNRDWRAGDRGQGCNYYEHPVFVVQQPAPPPQQQQYPRYERRGDQFQPGDALLSRLNDFQVAQLRMDYRRRLLNRHVDLSEYERDDLRSRSREFRRLEADLCRLQNEDDECRREQRELQSWVQLQRWGAHEERRRLLEVQQRREWLREETEECKSALNELVERWMQQW